jgi:hypothetical protein
MLDADFRPRARPGGDGSGTVVAESRGTKLPAKTAAARANVTNGGRPRKQRCAMRLSFVRRRSPIMPLVLMQRAWRDDPKYKDTEFSVYHYPQRYFDQIQGGEKFVYYRPSRGAKSGETSAYFGCGELGDWWTDPGDPNHRFAGVRKPIQFAAPAPHVDPSGRMYESAFTGRSAFQGHSVRHIHDLDYYRILDAAGLTGAVWREAPTIDDVLSELLVPAQASGGGEELQRSECCSRSHALRHGSTL